MMAAARRWFLARSLRERWSVGVAAALAVAVLVWAGVIRPLGDALDSARTRHADAVVRLGETRAMVAALPALKQQPAEQTGVPLEDLIRSKAADAGFALDNVTAQPGGTVQVVLPSARPGPLFAWLAGLEEGGVLVGSLSMRDSGDGTVACDIVLKPRGR